MLKPVTVLKNKMNFKINKNHRIYLLILLGLSSLGLLFQNCSRQYDILGNELSSLRKESVQVFELNEDDSPQTFGLENNKTLKASKYRIMLNGEELIIPPETSSKQIKALNGFFSKFNKNKGTFTYQPNPDYNGNQTIEFQIYNDSFKNWYTYYADLIVVPVNDAPQAKDGSVSPKKNQTQQISLDVFQAQDIDGDELNISILDENKNLINEWSKDFITVRVVPGFNNKLEVLTSLAGAISVPVRIYDKVSFIDVHLLITPENPLLDFKPALAVNKTHCLMCHAQVDGNFMTTMGVTENKAGISFFPDQSSTSWQLAQYGDYQLGTWKDHSAYYAALTNFINGTVFLPHKNLDAPVKASTKIQFYTMQSSIDVLGNGNALKILDLTSIVSPILKSMMAEPSTGGQYWYSTSKFRTNQYINLLKNNNIIQKYNGKTLNANTKVNELRSINIAAPTASIIRSKLRSQEKVSYYPQSISLPNLENFGNQPARIINGVQQYIWGNNPNKISICNGDIFVDGSVWLKDLKLDSQFGCRIHATGTIFISGRFPNELVPSETPSGILWINKSEQSSIELTSSTAIFLGLGVGAKDNELANIYSRITHPASMKPSQNILDDVNLLVPTTLSPTDPSLLFDASIDGRSVQFERVLLNAPMIHSRYSGDFRGVVIADFVLWSLGQFKYHYDNVFDRVPVFPMIEPTNFFDVKKCEGSKSVQRDGDQFIECLP